MSNPFYDPTIVFSITGQLLCMYMPWSCPSHKITSYVIVREVIGVNRYANI